MFHGHHEEGWTEARPPLLTWIASIAPGMSSSRRGEIEIVDIIGSCACITEQDWERNGNGKLG
jgi:hypothetical protein